MDILSGNITKPRKDNEAIYDINDSPNNLEKAHQKTSKSHRGVTGVTGVKMKWQSDKTGGSLVYINISNST